MDKEVVPLFRLNNKQEADAYHAILDELLKSEYWAFGPKTLEFEQTFCEKFGHKHAIGVSNGTAAIQVVLSSMNAQQVWMADTTFVGVWCAAKNVASVKDIQLVAPLTEDFWDVTTEAWVTALSNESLNPRFVIVTHLYGSRSNVDIAKLKALGNVIVIEDMSQCHGLTHSPYSDAQIYSMYPTKNVGALGEAGVITTDNEELAKLFKSNSFYGYNKTKDKVRAAGCNYKMDELQAAFVNHKLQSRFTEGELVRRRLVATTYNKGIKPTEKVVLVPFSDDATYHLYPIWVADRVHFRKFMADNDIQTGCHYDHSIFTMVTPELEQNTSEWNDHVVTLPMGGWVTPGEINHVCDVVNRYDA